MSNRNVLVYEIVGMFFIIFLGSALHFTYEWSGKLAVVGFVSAVDEAVWEHLKLAFWPSLLWMIIEFLPLRKITNNFITAKAIGTCLMVVFIPIVFYSYTAFTGRSIFPIDITTFIIAVVIGQALSYSILKRRQLPSIAGKIALVALVLLGVIFIVFTFYPPHLPIFQDPNTGGYGIAL